MKGESRYRGRPQNVTETSRTLPARSTESVTVSPGLNLDNNTDKGFVRVTASALTEMMTSFACRPDLSAAFPEISASPVRPDGE